MTDVGGHLNENVFDSLLEGVVILNEDRKFRYANEAFANLCEVPLRRMKPGTPIQDIITCSPESWSEGALPRGFTGTTSYKEISFKSKSGKEGFCQVSIQSITLSGENAFLLYFRDVTLEERLQNKYLAELQSKEGMIKSLDRKVFELSFLLGMSGPQAGNAGSEALLISALEKLMTTFKLQAAAFAAVSEDKSGKSFIIKTIKCSDGPGTPATRDLCQKIIAGQSEAIANALNDGSVLPLKDLGNEATAPSQSFVVVPLKGRSSDVGVIVLLRGQGSAVITDDDLNLFKAMASQTALMMENAALYEQSITDEMTQLFNNRYFHYRLDGEIKRAARSKTTFGLLLLDVDHFKKFNDKYGHQTGDQVLMQVAAAMKATCRSSDLPARYGGEEFTIILTDTDAEGIMIAAERVRKCIEAIELKTEAFGILKVTASIGAALFPISATTEKDLIEKADQALYKAKGAGRNNSQKGW